MSKTAHILAADASRIPAAIKFHTGFHAMDADGIADALCALFIGPRPLLEQDENFRQIIPYVVIKQGSDFIGYVRGHGGGEARLHGKIAIGVGGHIDLPDIRMTSDGSVALWDTINDAACREIEEEVHFLDRGHLVNAAPPRWVGLLLCNDTAVDRVHIGVVGVLDVECEVLSNEDDSLTELDLFTAAELGQNEDRLENWTRLLLPFINHL